MLQTLIDKLREELPGYHFEIQIYPAGGLIDADACEECGTKESASSAWRYDKGRIRTLDDAFSDLKTKLQPNAALTGAEGVRVEGMVIRGGTDEG